MTPILKFAAGLLIIGIVIFFSCKKDSEEADNHFPPVAKAGPDVALTISSCSGGVVALDGTASSDPDDNIRSYRWTQISGPGSSTLTDYTSAKAKVRILSNGQYVFELKVTDAGGWSSKDTMLINVAGPFGEYDLDVTINGSFTFTDNYKDCYYGPPCYYYDLTTIQDSFDFPPIGEFNFSVNESADTAISSNNHGTFINFYASNNSGPGASGSCSVNFKELIQNGGGSFNGTVTAYAGSAQACDQNIYANLAPLTVTGNLETTAHTITLNLKGKIYF